MQRKHGCKRMDLMNKIANSTCCINVAPICKKSLHINNIQAYNSLRDPDRIQTCDFQNRNLTFYSAELRGQIPCKDKKVSGLYAYL